MIMINIKFGDILYDKHLRKLRENVVTNKNLFVIIQSWQISKYNFLKVHGTYLGLDGLSKIIVERR